MAIGIDLSKLKVAELPQGKHTFNICGESVELTLQALTGDVAMSIGVLGNELENNPLNAIEINQKLQRIFLSNSVVGIEQHEIDFMLINAIEVVFEIIEKVSALNNKYNEAKAELYKTSKKKSQVTTSIAEPA